VSIKIIAWNVNAVVLDCCGSLLQILSGHFRSCADGFKLRVKRVQIKVNHRYINIDDTKIIAENKTGA
jgi:hypothetical protein